MSHLHALHWWDDITERITLARWLVDEGHLDPNDVSGVLDVIEKPAKYTPEYHHMCHAITIERAQRLLA